MREKDLKILSLIGLSRTESKIYFDLIENLDSSITEIALRTNLYRPNVYDAVKKLKQKGLAIEIIRKGKKFFRAADLERLKSYAEQIGEDLERFIIDLKKISKNNQQKEEVSLSEGFISLKKEMLRFLEKENTFLNVLGNVNFLKKKTFLKEFHKQRIKKKIPLKVIFRKRDKKTIGEINKMPYSEARYLSLLKESKMSTVITKDSIYFLLNKGEDLKDLILIKIKQEDIAKEQNSFFSCAWKESEKL